VAERTAVLVVGEALIDAVVKGGEITGEHVGGSPANVAFGVGALGHDVSLATWIGHDEHGDRILARCADAGVTVVPGSTGAERTSVAYASIDARGQATPSWPGFAYEDLLPIGDGRDPRTGCCRPTDGVSDVEGPGRAQFLEVDPRRCACSPRRRCTTSRTTCARRTSQQLRKILDDPEASNNDKFVALDLLKNANIAAGGVLPMCQDTGTAIVMGKRGSTCSPAARRGRSPRRLRRLHPATCATRQMAPLTMWDEVNTGNNLPAQIELYADTATPATRRTYKFLFMAKGGGSANKSLPVPGDQGDPQPRRA
jgi:hypothetical protein